MVRALGAVVLMMTVASVARGEEPPPRHAAEVEAPAPAASAVLCAAPADAADERAFAAELERFARLRSFTEQLMAKREAEAFERAALRQTRIAKLQRELTEREVALSEREFDEAVALYLKKRQLTRELAAAAARAKTLPAESPSAAPRL